MHIRAEHLHLFPLVIQEVGSRVGLDPSLSLREVIAAVRTLRTDHNFFMTELSRALKLAREATYSRGRAQIDRGHIEVRRILNELGNRLKTHNELEEQIVYRLPKRVMTAPRQSLLASQVSHELKTFPQRFKASRGFDDAPEKVNE